jgi:Sec-independent protein translocase protein TatA
MEIFGIGPLEVLLILVIALIVMGPNDMVKTGRTIGKFLRQVVKSPTWQAVQQTSRDLRYLPNKLMREAGMEEEVAQLKEIGKNVKTMGEMESSLQAELGKVSQELQQTGKDLSAWTTSQDEPLADPLVEPVIQPPAKDLSAWTTSPTEPPAEPLIQPPSKPETSPETSSPEDVA